MAEKRKVDRALLEQVLRLVIGDDVAIYESVFKKGAENASGKNS